VQLKPRWQTETIARGCDANVGARLTQLTSAALISHNIYCEERYTSADGGFIAQNGQGLFGDVKAWSMNLTN